MADVNLSSITATDAQLRDRATHTGTQLAATVSDFTAAARTAAVADTITDAVTNVAPSQNAVFDALALKVSAADAFTAYTPTVTAGVGTLTTVGAVSGRYLKRGKTVYVLVDVTITTNGTGSSQVLVSLPAAPGDVAGGLWMIVGRQVNAGNSSLHGSCSGQTIFATKYDGTYPGADGMRLVLSGVYEVA